MNTEDRRSDHDRAIIDDMSTTIASARMAESQRAKVRVTESQRAKVYALHDSQEEWECFADITAFKVWLDNYRDVTDRGFVPEEWLIITGSHVLDVEKPEWHVGHIN